ncbi:MAG: hypothetical protein OXC81_05865, partial [Betaproteobacteria bacterium]|nr:hypothetical protein [Betaproteobacteria bacterium]
FVIGCRTALDLPREVWERIAGCCRPLRRADISFAGAFGRMRLAAEDIKTHAYAFSCAEADFIGQWRNMAAESENIEIVANTPIVKLSDENRQASATDAAGKTYAADCLAVAGLGSKLLEPAGFTCTERRYRQPVFAASIADDDADDCNCASERVLASGAATLIPRPGGWGFVMIASTACTQRLKQLPPDKLLAEIASMHGCTFSTTAQLISRGCFQPALRLSKPGGRGPIALLGASACALNPIGAQELNLAVRDCILLARLLASAKTHALPDIGRMHAAGRVRDRQAAVRRTDMAARLAAANFPGKRVAGGLLAAIGELAPPVRRACLAAWVLPNG